MPAAKALQPSLDDAFARAVRQHLAGDTVTAVALYRHALQVHPRHAPAANNLAALLAANGKRSEAEGLFRSAVVFQPDYGEALNNLGILLAEGGEHEEARACFERATVLEPGKAGWHNNHANTLLELFRFDAAVAAYDRAIAVDPNAADYWSNRALALRGLRRTDEAIQSLVRALELAPRHINALSNLGVLLKEARRFTEAEQVFHRAISLDPNNPAILANFASVFERTGDYAAVRSWAERARAADPSYAEAYNLLANVEMEGGRFHEAEALYQRVIGLDPHNRNANWNLALLWLLRGDFERGWPQFEWRKRLQSVVFDHGDYGPSEWKGESLSGKTILLHSEQGIGDAIQFIRYAPHLKAAGAARVVVEAPFPIVRLLASVPGVDQAIARGMPLPAYDAHANLMSLPGLMGTTLDTVPAHVPYISAASRPVGSVIAAHGTDFKVGVVWAGNPVHARDFLRSAPLSEFVSLCEVPGTAFFSLQKGEGAESDLRALALRGITDLAPQLLDFEDTAAAILALDLVVTVDTSVAHLAGALGVPTWVLLPCVPDFRWMLDRSDSPWYPTVRLFRQPTPGDWPSVMSAVRAALCEAVAVPRGSRSTSANAAPLPNDLVTISSATLDASGQPRFTLSLPLASLADPATFAEYEAELLNGGAYRATREFLREMLSPQDVYVDAYPGLGVVALEAASLLRTPSAIRIVANQPTQTRLRSQLASCVPGAVVGCGDTIAQALHDAAPSRVVLRLHAQHADQLAQIAEAGPSLPDVIVWEHIAPAGVGVLTPLEALGYVHLTLTLDGEEVSLDTVSAPLEEQVLVSLSLPALSSLTGETPRSVLPPQPVGQKRLLGIDWELRSDTGWGVYGINLALELARNGDPWPVVLATGPLEVSPLVAARLTPVLPSAATRSVSAADGVMLRALGNNVAHASSWDSQPARRNAGIIFFEDTALDAAAVTRAAGLDLIVAGSTWNAQVLQAHGLTNVVTVPQGVDPAVFHPAPRAGLFPDRFVIFSGGKLEYRKGQDLVVAAFREFHRRHTDALLVAAWHNAWPALISDLDLAGHLQGLPVIRDGQLDLLPWLAANGIPTGAAIDVGRQPNALMGQVIREADVALFPNRCEGGTNLVAMECMASGVPTIVSANTGHLDLVATGGCCPLIDQQRPKHPTRFFKGSEGWGESTIEEILTALEAAYTDREMRLQLGQRAAQSMTQWTWRHQVKKLLDTLAPLW